MSSTTHYITILLAEVGKGSFIQLFCEFIRFWFRNKNGIAIPNTRTGELKVLYTPYNAILKNVAISFKS